MGAYFIGHASRKEKKGGKKYQSEVISLTKKEETSKIFLKENWNKRDKEYENRTIVACCQKLGLVPLFLLEDSVMQMFEEHHALLEKISGAVLYEHTLKAFIHTIYKTETLKGFQYSLPKSLFRYGKFYEETLSSNRKFVEIISATNTYSNRVGSGYTRIAVTRRIELVGEYLTRVADLQCSGLYYSQSTEVKTVLNFEARRLVREGWEVINRIYN